MTETGVGLAFIGGWVAAAGGLIAVLGGFVMMIEIIIETIR